MKNPRKLFDKKMVCPNCHNEFETKSPFTSRLRVLEYKSDGHKIYKDCSPYYYEVSVCPFCGFAFTNRLNNPVYEEDVPKLLEYFKNVKNFSNYTGERTIQDAIRISKLALIIAKLMEEPHTLVGAQFLKTAWLYREIGDEKNELANLRLVKEHLTEAFESEDFEYFGLSAHVLYNILAETSRTLDDYSSAAKFYEKLFKSTTAPIYMKQRAQNNWLEYNGRF
ncbi:DUF2225 domain-containing protein [Criibacterium bergeronii]|uniref:DUF2225 domain-containing protein n=1 Tax=Criibacterium bergeronii TaxID=1871336 RepID=A0A371IM53_9FIRM|nr:DUF2225 domain-containing protein [Criibacterium bergeronii]MBS6063443.1 DUF2225 domain-containing protein [Peptostreptococcaceae bacterium]RDY21558.1 DUF2225 domain-containing protein [Criibacterium bergeronii]TRW24202.1 DUF2225 domain-containing protein [Criibacterium bergeronii]